MTEPRLMVAADAADLANRAAERFTELAGAAIHDHGTFRVAFSGGNTPRLLYERLATVPYLDEIDWPRVQVFFSDERFVPPSSPQSNYYLAEETLLGAVPIPKDQVYLVPTVDISPQDAAAAYQRTICQVFAASSGEIPHFDLILLGMGPDGHTASLFPDTEALHVTDRLVAANWVPQADMWRITFTYPLINAGLHVAFLVEGAGKAERVAQVMAGENFPAAGVNPHPGQLEWWMDRAAAAKLPHGG